MRVVSTTSKFLFPQQQQIARSALLKRFFSSNIDSTTIAFDRSLKKIQRNNVAKSFANKSGEYDYIRTELALRLVDRLDDIIRDEGFPLALDIGAGPGYIYKEIVKDDGFNGSGGIGGVRKIVMLDSSEEMLHRDEEQLHNIPDELKQRCSVYRLIADEEGPLTQFPDGTFDLVLSAGAMHSINDLPGLWKEIRRVLKPDGCFMFAMVGGSTLNELRSSMVLAELERDGGVSPHVGPFVEFSDVGALLTNAGFNLTTIDIDTIKVGYPNAFVLMEHLQRMGESNVCINRRDRMTVDTFLASACIYDGMYPLENQEPHENDIEATVQVIYGIGWAPDSSQPKPKERGSASHKIGDIVINDTKNSQDKRN